MRRILLVFTIICSVFIYIINLQKKQIKQIQSSYEKVKIYFQMMNMWLEMKQKGRSAVEYLQKKGIKRIAIYGMREFGERFYEEAKNGDIEVVCIIDKEADQIKGDFLVISPEQTFPKVDAIIVTADYYYNEIWNVLKTKVDCPIYSLKGVLGNSFCRYL